MILAAPSADRSFLRSPVGRIWATISTGASWWRAFAVSRNSAASGAAAADSVTIGMMSPRCPVDRDVPIREPVQAGRSTARGRAGLEDLADERTGGPGVHEGLEQPLLATAVRVDGRGRDACPPRDALHAEIFTWSREKWARPLDLHQFDHGPS